MDVSQISVLNVQNEQTYKTALYVSQIMFPLLIQPRGIKIVVKALIIVGTVCGE